MNTKEKIKWTKKMIKAHKDRVVGAPKPSIMKKSWLAIRRLALKKIF